MSFDDILANGAMSVVGIFDIGLIKEPKAIDPKWYFKQLLNDFFKGA